MQRVTPNLADDPAWCSGDSNVVEVAKLSGESCGK
jgi:hypothetical protein